MNASTDKAPLPRGGYVDKVAKMGWKVADCEGVPFLAHKRDLHIDATYQRTMVSETRIAQIVREWSWVACGAIIVSERDGKLWVIDGQHRVVAAMRRSDIDEIPCLVFKFASVEDEAIAFHRANSVRGNVSPFDKLRALLTARDQLAIDVVGLMESQGYKPTSSTGAAYTVLCIAAFVLAMRQSRQALTRVWPLVAKLHEGLQIKKSVLDAMVYIAKFGTDDITSPSWERRVLKHGLHEIDNAIARAHSLFERGGAKIFAQVTVDLINRGMPKSARMGLGDGNDDEDE